MIKSILPFVAIALFLIALVARKRHNEPFSCFSAAAGWLFFAGYCYFAAADFIARSEYFDGGMAFVFLVFAVIVAVLILITRNDALLLLFSTDMNFKDELEKGIIPVELKEAFSARKLHIPKRVRVLRRNEWRLVTGIPRDYIAIAAPNGRRLDIYKDRRVMDILFMVTKVALISAVLYFPFAVLPAPGDAIISCTARLTTILVNLSGSSVYLVPPSYIYTTSSAFRAAYNPIEIVLACTAIQSMVLFAGLIFSVDAQLSRKIKAFMVSVPVIYGLNLIRNTFVCVAYYGQWFGSPATSFMVAHGEIARVGVLISLIIIAYMVFTILPEALDLVEDSVRLIYNFLLRRES